MKLISARNVLILVGIVILLTLIVALFLFKKNIQPNTTYFSTQEECQAKTYSTCICMVTKLDTVNSNPDCIGWAP